jgi:hypothetical protein
MSDRREFLSRIAVSGLALHGFANKAAGSRSNIRAVAFDGFLFSIRGPYSRLWTSYTPSGALN